MRIIKNLHKIFSLDGREEIRNYLYCRSFEKDLENYHEGDRCFIIGTGPSLNKTNFDYIRNEILFGCNTLYLGFEKFWIICDYYAVSDMEVFRHNWREILGLKTNLFLTGGARDLYSQIKNEIPKYVQKIEYRKPVLLKTVGQMLDYTNFSRNPFKGVYNGWNIVIDVCLQMTHFLGFKTVYLVGCDCDYSGKHRFDGSVTENLRGLGVMGKWKPIFNAYRICKSIFEERNRYIYNATVGGKLEIFERVKLEDIGEKD